MLQKMMCGYITSVSKFKSNPKRALAEAQGDAIAVSFNNEIQFYAVPAAFFEEMVNFCEYAQRGMIELAPTSGRFKLTENMVEEMKGRLSDYSGVADGDYIESDEHEKAILIR